MLVLNLKVRWRKTVSLVMILAVIQTGLIGGSIPVLAQSGETVSDAVYQNDTLPTGVAETVYDDEVQGPVLPPPETFLQQILLDQVTAPSGILTVSGQVYENSTGMPLSGVTVQLLLDGQATQFSTSTDSQGSYSLTGVGPGQYQLTFQHPGYAPENFGLEINGADIKQDCNLLRNSSFKGQVVDELGDPLEGVQVTIADQNIPDRDFQLSTNADGWFNLTDVPPGRYKLSVSQSVYHQQEMVWVDECPLELTMVLRGVEPFPSTVLEEVYVENPPTVNEQPGEGGEANSDLPNAEDGVNEPSGEGGEANSDLPSAEDGVNEPSGEGGEVNSDLPDTGDEVNEPPGEGGEANNNLPDIGDGDNEPPIESETVVNMIQPLPGRKNYPVKPFLKRPPEILPIREHDPLTELYQLLQKQAITA